ncbi:hypothetical protein ACOMHN_044197 [Nucella lapillus]
MAKMARFGRVAQEYGDVADFLIVYIQESHPADGWAFNTNPYTIRNHRSLQDRVAAARQLLQGGAPCPLVVDNMADEANYVYGGLYERLYVVLDSTIVYAGERGPYGYRLDEVEDWLAAFAAGTRRA